MPKSEPKPAKGWAVVTPRGEIMVPAFMCDQGSAIREVFNCGSQEPGWRHASADGYRCVRVEVRRV